MDSNLVKENYNRYMRRYFAVRYKKRRLMVVKFLGGKCNKCNCTENLQVDHIDYKNKTFGIDQLWKASEKRFWEEVKKCQLLCKNCHIEKTILERGNKLARGTHGTLSSLRYCKCNLCKEAKSKWMREYSKTHRRFTINGKRVWKKINPLLLDNR